MERLIRRGAERTANRQGKRFPHDLSHEYLGIDPPAEKDDAVRVIIRVVRRKIAGCSA